MTRHAAQIAMLGVTMVGCMPEGPLAVPTVYGFTGEALNMQLSTLDPADPDLALVAYDANVGDGDWMQVTMRSGRSRFIVHEPNGDGWGFSTFVGVEKRRPPQHAHVAMVGDSITANGVITSRVREHLEPLVVTITNHAVSGKTWRWYAVTPAGVAVVDDVLAAEPDVVTWMLGTNDLFTASDDTFENKLQAEIAAAETLFARFPSTTTHVVSPPPPGADHHEAYASPDPLSTRQRWRDRTDATAQAYAAAWGQRADVLIVPAHLSVHRSDHYSTTDAVHPEAPGLQSMGDAFAAAALHALQQ